jgi:hypothetical protein
MRKQFFEFQAKVSFAFTSLTLVHWKLNHKIWLEHYPLWEYLASGRRLRWSLVTGRILVAINRRLQRSRDGQPHPAFYRNRDNQIPREHYPFVNNPPRRRFRWSPVKARNLVSINRRLQTSQDGQTHPGSNGTGTVGVGQIAAITSLFALKA